VRSFASASRPQPDCGAVGTRAFCAFHEKGIRIVSIKARFCSHCGSPFGSRSPAARDSGMGPCATCGTAQPLQGPSLLVLVAIFAADRILLQRRGIAPYIGKWAPPGGYVECNESLEAAAVREVWEEARVALEPEQLVPCAVISLPRLNQIHHGFIVRLPAPVPAEPVPPESTEVGWFTEAQVSALDNWEPGAAIDFGIQFSFFRTPAFEFIQQTDRFLRILGGGGIRYL
jgi:ADP-ribose pyrophosphatase YjhB (NUDIX family)